MSLLFAVIFLFQAAPGPLCRDVTECRAQAEAAAGRGDYETFHDLAWRAVQKGQRNDPDLMLLLARAQSLSGRPDDALVMLERIVDLGGKPDVISNPDFARVRQLPRFSELATRLAPSSALRVTDDKPSAPGGGAPSTPGRSVPAASAPAPAVLAPAPSPTSAPATPIRSAPPVPARTRTTPSPSGSPSPAPVTPEPSASPVSPAATAAPSPPPSAASAAPALSFDPPQVSAPVALAHDSVSRRFLLGDRASSRLFIVDELSHHVVNYASGATAGFFRELTGFAIDARRGDLWVTSAEGGAADGVSTLHKLQLVSGRTLMEVALPDGAGATRLVDVTITPDGTVYAIDAVEPRLFRARPGVHRLEQVVRLEATHPTALTAVDDRLLYVADDEGLLRVDVTSKKAARVKSVEPLTRFVSLAWHAGALVGVEQVADSFLVVRITLDASGTRAQPRAILAASPEPIVGTLTPAGYYYLIGGTIRLVKLR